MAVANGEIMTPKTKAILPLSKHLTTKAKAAFVFNDIQSEALISIGQLCDNDYIAIFSKYDVKIVKKNTILIVGKRTDNGLWNIPLQESTLEIPPKTTPSDNTIPVANGVVKLDNTKTDLAQYYAATLFNPTESTLLSSIENNHFPSWPEFTQTLVRKHLPKKIETAQGHLDQESKNIRSTKNQIKETKYLLPQSGQTTKK